MSHFIFAYHGGNRPDTPEEGAKVMAQWEAWFKEMGDAVVNPGNPVGMSKTVSGSDACRAFTSHSTKACLTRSAKFPA